MKKININIVSESVFTVQGHGVHTAYVEMMESLSLLPELNVKTNLSPMEEINITHIHTVGTFAFRRLVSKKGGKKVVSAHIVPESLVGSIIGAEKWLPIFKKYLRWFYNKADLVVAVSEKTKVDLQEMGVNSEIKVVDNTIDTFRYKTTAQQKSDLRKKLNLSAKEFIIVGNGQIQPRKKFDEFIEVAKKLPKYHFIWIGGIPFKALGADYIGLNKLMKNPPKNVTITGVITQSNATDYMRAADVMFMPSIQETFGLSIVEGAASGLPVIVRDIPDYNLTFEDFVLRSDSENFVKEIDKLAKDKKYYEKWRKSSKNIAKKYDSTAGAKKLLGIYQDILK